MQHGCNTAGSNVRHLSDPSMAPLSHNAAETIYRSLFVQARGVLKKELIGHLRSERTIRRSKRADPNGDRRGANKDLVSISARPAAVEDRAVPCHCEGDLLSGSENSTRFDLIVRPRCLFAEMNVVSMQKLSLRWRARFHLFSSDPASA